jgi:hypothetical protein
MLSEPVHLEWGSETWDNWDPAAIASQLEGVHARWFVVGGWALDLFHGRTTRKHDDLEIAVPMWDFDLIRDRLSTYEFFVAGAEGFWPVESAGGAFFQYQQTFVRDPQTHLWCVDVMRVPDDREHWICSSDRSIRRPFVEAIARSPEGVPYLRPEFVLLYKGLETRPKDQSDFDAAVPLLSDRARMVLHDALLQTKGVGHPWLPALSRI